MPVDSMLRYYLIRERNFNEASVDGFIKDFRSSLAFAKLNVPPTMDTGSALNDQPETDYDDMSTEVAMPPSHSGTSIDASAQMRRQAAPVQTPLVPAAGFLDESYPLDGGRAFILRRPESLSREELEEFDAWVTLLQRKMKRLLQQ